MHKRIKIMQKNIPPPLVNIYIPNKHKSKIIANPPFSNYIYYQVVNPFIHFILVELHSKGAYTFSRFNDFLLSCLEEKKLEKSKVKHLVTKEGENYTETKIKCCRMQEEKLLWLCLGSTDNTRVYHKCLLGYV